MIATMLCATLVAAALLAPAVRADILDPEFYKTDWTDVCATGNAQTPIDLESVESVAMPENLISSFKFPIVKGVKLKNTGTALKVRRRRARRRHIQAACSTSARCFELRRADRAGALGQS